MKKQFFKSLYLEDYPTEAKNKTFTIAFNNNEKDFFSVVRSMSTYDILKTISCKNYLDIKAKAESEDRSINQFVKRLLKQNISSIKKTSFNTKDVTFINSKDIPFQRWYPYLEGYSPKFVLDVIEHYCTNSTLIYEPFAGTGTTLFASENKAISTLYSEVNPLLRFLIKEKITVLSMPKDKRVELANVLQQISNNIFIDLKKIAPSQELNNAYLAVFEKSIYFPKEQYLLILKLRTYINQIQDARLQGLLTIAVFACLLPVSYLKKQGDVRFKTALEREKEQKKLEQILPQKIMEIARDLEHCDFSIKQNHSLLCENAKNISSMSVKEKISDVITSPPYLNGTNYFRNTKLELWFIGELHSKYDLRHYRDEALTSGINDVKKDLDNTTDIPNSVLLKTTLMELQKKAYDKRIPLMVKCYFSEMRQVFDGLTRHLKNNSNVLIDIGDSIFSDVHIKTDAILAEILSEFGYSLKERIVLRSRRSRNGKILSQVLLVLKYNNNECK